MTGLYQSEPAVIRDSPTWSVVFKPHEMPTAPLRSGEAGTLLAWYLGHYPAAECVKGKKTIEKGLIHRLDTPTEGLVLIAKTQETYDAFQEAQGRDLIIKTYSAVCDAVEGSALNTKSMYITRGIESRFRSWGPGGREVRPVFLQDRRFEGAGRTYTTHIESCEPLGLKKFRILCTLTRGYRHQVRVHLASIGFPIEGDRLYNPLYSGEGPAVGDDRRSGSMPSAILRLSAVTLTFPDPDSGSTITISLPPQDKTSP